MDPKEKALKLALHLDANLKHKMLNLPPNKFQILADKMGIPPIQLSRILKGYEKFKM